MSVTRLGDPRQTTGLVRLLVERLEQLRDRALTLEEQTATCEELLAVASGAAADRGGEISPRELLIDTAETDREHVEALLHAVGIEPWKVT